MKKQQKFKVNPFLEKLGGVMYIQPRAATVLKKDEKVISSSGEVLKESKMLMGRQKLVDKSQFGKVYIKSLGALMDLKPNTVKVLMYLVGKIDFENKAFLNYREDFKELQYKNHVSVYKGLLELLEHDMIAATIYPHFWWISPILICKGERFAMYTEYIKDKGGTYRDAVNNVTKGKQKFEQLKMFDENNQPVNPEPGAYEKKAKNK